MNECNSEFMSHKSAILSWNSRERKKEKEQIRNKNSELQGVNSELWNKKLQLLYFSVMEKIIIKQLQQNKQN